MDKLKIGEVIQRLRKQNKITQEQLANHIGISTAAISKWESGSSYPDIVTLPTLARFFNVTIDDLMNFKITLTQEDINKIVEECEILINQGELIKATNLCEKYINKYPQSYLLKFNLCRIYNMCNLLNNEEDKVTKWRGRCIELLEEIVNESNDIKLIEQSLFQLSSNYMILEKFDKAEACLKKIHKPEVNPHTILSSIYVEQGNIEEARKVLQNNVLYGLADMYSSCSMLAATYYNSNKNILKEHIDTNIAKRYVDLSMKIKELLNPEGKRLMFLDANYLILSEMYMKEGDIESAILNLEKMLENIKYGVKEGIIETNQVWCFNYLPDKNQINSESALKIAIENLVVTLDIQFESIKDNNRFAEIVTELRKIARI
ncbi:MAG: helix-turn-helix domain-containing protein [Peptostreptococcaceae bacterium]